MYRIFSISHSVRILLFLFLSYILFSGFRDVSNTAQTQTRDSAEIHSIAVLPFVNMSTDKSQEYFSDGIAEEILNALAKIEGLRVAARTSSLHSREEIKTFRPSVKDSTSTTYSREAYEKMAP